MIHFNRRIQGESQNKKDIRKIYYRIISYGQSEISVFVTIYQLDTALFLGQTQSI